MLALILSIAVTSAPTVLVQSPGDCSDSIANEVSVRVFAADLPKPARVLVFSAALGPKGEYLQGDSTMAEQTEKIAPRVRVPGVRPNEARLSGVGWKVLRSIHIEVDKKLVLTVNLSIEQAATGACILVYH
ncbi:MAG: hypothetical protein JNM17_21110 [Archangium sp.]|nr:hypothetical protein [Archangium sp.]